MENKSHNQNKKNNKNNLKNKNSSNKKKEPSLFEKYSPINNINYNNNQEKKENHIYFNFYTNQQKEKNIEKETLNQKFHDKNIKFLKLKEIENKKKKENEIKKKKQEEYENTKEFREKQIEKLYLASININKKKHQKNKNSISKKNNNIKNDENNENNGKINEYINNFQQKEIERIEKEKLIEKIKNLPKGTLIINKIDYENILKNLYKERKIINDELNKMPLSNKTHKQMMRESFLLDLLDQMDKKIEKFEKKISIEIIDI